MCFMKLPFKNVSLVSITLNGLAWQIRDDKSEF